MRKYLLLLSNLFFLITAANAQTEYKGLPQDLDKETLIFVKFDQLRVPEGKPRGIHEKKAYSFITNHNENCAVSNQQLEEELNDYPFDYKVVYYSELESLKQTDYKYVLMFEPIETLYESGLYTSGESSPLMIKNIKSGDTYKLKNFDNKYIYYYKGFVKHLNKRVNKQYNI